MTAAPTTAPVEQASKPAAGKPRNKSVRNERLVSIAVPIGLLAVWEILSRIGVLDARFFPPPTGILSTAVELIKSGELFDNTWISLRRLLLAMVIGGVPALLLGLAMGLYRKLRIGIEPIISATYPIPKSAIFPLFLLIFGLGEASKVAIVAVGVFYPIVVNTVAGVLEINKVYHDVGKNFHAGRWQTFRTIALPGALPVILTGVNLAFGMALMLIVVAEMLGATSGLGFMIWNAWQTFSVETMYVGLIVISALGFLFSLALKELSALLVPWRARN
jgi:ABC-type nitrate/sulfonate/bicarbonate transport system permease component